MREPCTIIYNPRASGGRLQRLWPSIRSALGELPLELEFLATQDRGHAIELAGDALAAGAKRIIAVGGDGTVNEVLSGFLDPQTGKINSEACLGIVAVGSGCDFRRALGKMEPLAQAKSLAHAPVLAVDCGVANFQDRQGMQGRRAFLNVASVGISGLVDKMVDAAPKGMGAKAAYLSASLRAIAKHRASMVTVTIDDAPPIDIPLDLLVMGNGQYFGAGMWVCPNAKIDDGLLDTIILPRCNRLTILSLLAKVFSGNHLNDKRVQAGLARKVSLHSQEPVWIDLDGEAVGTLPATFEILPGPLRLWTLPQVKSSVLSRAVC